MTGVNVFFATKCSLKLKQFVQPGLKRVKQVSLELLVQMWRSDGVMARIISRIAGLAQYYENILILLLVFGRYVIIAFVGSRQIAEVRVQRSVLVLLAQL